MRSAQEMIDAFLQGGKKPAVEARKKKETDVSEVLEKAAYRRDDGALGFPNTAFQNLILAATKGLKAPGKRSGLGYDIQGLFRVEPGGLLPVLRNGKPLKDYGMDVRTAVNSNTRPPARIVVARPMVELPWLIPFDVIWSPEWSPVEDFPQILRQLLQRGGQSIGIGAFRPERKGWFGQFEVTGFEAIE
jgi:hypothetical protein